MKPAMQRDISEARNVLAKLAAKLPEFPPADLVDIGAQMKELSRLAINIADGWTKEKDGQTIIAQAGCKQLMRPRAKVDAGFPGSFIVTGEHWRAIFSPYDQTYYATAELAAEFPDIAAKFKRSKPCERVNYKGLATA